MGQGEKARLAELEKKRRYYARHRDEIREKHKAYYQRTKVRAKERARRWYQRNKEHVRAQNLAWKAANPELFRAYSRKCRWKQLGIEFSAAEYATMFKHQRGKCALCKRELVTGGPVKKHTPCVDHCHKKNLVRGILCNGCNRALGIVEGMLARSSAKRVLRYLGLLE